MRFALVGADSLLVQCGERLIELGHDVAVVVGDDRAVQEWCGRRDLRRLDRVADLAEGTAPGAFDVLLSIGYLRLIPEQVLAMARGAAVNFHDGPLPRYGGLNAPNWALLAGESEHGVTWHRMLARADAGPILVQKRFPIEARDTALTLNARCFEAGIESFDDLVTALEMGRAGEQHTLDRATCHTAADRPEGFGLLRWSRPARELDAMARALDVGPYRNPLATVKLWLGETHVLVTRCIGVEATAGRPGEIVGLDASSLTVAATGGAIRIERVAQPDGGPLTIGEVCASEGLSLGRILPEPGSDLLAGLARSLGAVARYERDWVARLERLQPTEVAAGVRGDLRVHVQKLPDDLPAGIRQAGETAEDALAAAAALFVSVLAGRSSFDVALPAAPGELTPATTQFLRRWVPARFSFEPAAETRSALDAAGATVRASRGATAIMRDLAHRMPHLAADAATLEVAIDSGNGVDRVEDEAFALVIKVSSDGTVTWRSRRLALDPADLARRFEVLLARLAADLIPTVSAAHLLTEAELALVRGRWAGDEIGSVPDRTIHAEFEARARENPDAVAASFDDASLTYRELDARASALARALRQRGVRAGEPIGICVERSLELLVAVLGVLKSGAAYVPLDPAYPATRLAFMIADSGMRIVVTQAHLSDLVGTDVAALCVETEVSLAVPRPQEAEPSQGTARDLAYIIYTSGSTGRPKGVMIEHRAVVNFFLAMDRNLGAAPGVWLAVTSLSFDISVLELLWTLTRGFRVVLYADANNAATAASVHPNAHRGIEFSLFYFSAAGGADASGRRDKYRLLLEGARFADRNDFAAVWTPERHFHAFGGLYPNPSVTSAAVAAVTERVGIRAGSCVLPLHHPIRVVEEWSMVDNLSNGRVGVSVAAGWQPKDFVLRPDAYPRAKALMFEDLETVRRLWRGESVTLPGPRGDVTLQCLPRPVQPELPIWVTTAGNVETFEAAGRVGARVLTHLLGQSLAEVGAKIAAYRAAWGAAGREGQGHVTLMLHTFVGQDTARVKELVREPMKSYLRTSIDLIKDFAAAFPTFKRTDGNLDFGALGPDEFDALLDYSFERYFETSGLFGDFARTIEMVDRVKGIGADEIACLIDFGVDDDVTLAHLHHLNRLRRLTSTPRVAGRQSIAALVERHGVTHLQCTPSMASMFVADDDTRAALGRLQCLLVGGEALTSTLARDLRAATGAHILNMYGPTETTIWSTCAEVDDGPVTIGRPLLNTSIFVLDPAGRPVPPGMAGELCIGGHGVARGYWNRPELSEERFVLESCGDPEQRTRVYRTGDLVRFDGTGCLEFLGRLDQQVKLRGYRIELGEIEAQLSAHPAVREAAVVVDESGPDGGRIVAYVVGRSEATPDALREWLKARLPGFMLPAVFVFLADLPRTPNRKIDRKALPAPREARPAPTRPSPLRSDLERRITAAWEEALRVDAAGLDDNFFDLGGHSLLAVQVHARLKRELAPRLTITDLFRYPTVRSLARFIEGDPDTREVTVSLERGAARRAALERRAGARPTKTP